LPGDVIGPWQRREDARPVDVAGMAILRNRIQTRPLTPDCLHIGGAVIRYNLGLSLWQWHHQHDNTAERDA